MSTAAKRKTKSLSQAKLGRLIWGVVPSRYRAYREVRKLGKIILWLALLLAIVTCLLVGASRVSQINAEKDRLSSINQTFAQMITISVQNFDYNSVNLVSEFLENHQHVRGVQVHDSLDFSLYETTRMADRIRNADTAEIFKANLTSGPNGEKLVGRIVIVYDQPGILPAIVTVILTFIFVFVSVFSICTIVVLYYVDRYVRQPISQLIDAMGETLRTREYKRVEYSEDTQLGMLANVFNSMQTVLESTQEEIEHTRKMKAIGTLTSGVAHELNNVLAIIQGNLELMELRGKLPEVVLPLHENMVNATKSGAATVNQLLAYSHRKPAGKQEYITASELVTEICDLSAPFLGDKITLHREVRHDVTLLPGKDELVAAVINLIKNACEAIQGPGEVWLIARKPGESEHLISDEGVNIPTLAIDVVDSGPGIQEEHGGRLFEPFFTTKEVNRGTGLGLWSVFNFVDGVGGRITHETPDKGGAHFTVLLPMLSGLPPVRGTSDVIATSLEGERVLLVEDETVLLEVLAELLKTTGAEVDEATNVQVANKKMSKNRYDVVFCDLHLPDGNGVDFCRFAREISRATLAILVSGNPDISESDLSVFDAILTKPVTLEKVCKAVFDAKSARTKGRQQETA